MEIPMNQVPVRSQIWSERPEPTNPFATRIAYCRGYDVYGDMLGKARWVDMLFLLFRGDRPSPSDASLLEAVAVALANPGPRDAAVHAAMCGGVGGSTAASCLIAALAVGAGQNGGSREIFLAMENWVACGTDLDKWRHQLGFQNTDSSDIWPNAEHPPGFDPHGVGATTPVKQTLSYLARLSSGPYLRWLEGNQPALEAAAAHPLALTGVTAAAWMDLGLTPEQGEMLHLLLRLPGAAAHALEQRQYSHKHFPFFDVELLDDPQEKV